MRENWDRANGVKIVVENKEYTGRYVVEKGVVTVRYGFNQLSTQQGGSTAESVARVLLAELINR